MENIFGFHYILVFYDMPIVQILIDKYRELLLFTKEIYSLQSRKAFWKNSLPF